MKRLSYYRSFRDIVWSTVGGRVYSCSKQNGCSGDLLGGPPAPHGFLEFFWNIHALTISLDLLP